MYLKALRLKGFKSFPKQTELLFEPGVGVIIGPNGSGKSNLADAVIWALGEQSPSTVRGSSMQDVIFAGSDGRRASGSAEVELTFDNSDGALPLPTPEVSVMRRVTRDGSSQYSINQSTCRLTDVVELLAQVGLGKELHSIIGQGKVESFLAGKPEDRRSQIEEAAGLGAYKRRRERAELKLREVRRNLERALLLEREVGSQLAPLRRQATAAEQMRTVRDRDRRDPRAPAHRRGRRARRASWRRAATSSPRSTRRARGYEDGLAKVAAARAREEETFAQEARRARAQRAAPAARARARRTARERAPARRAAAAPARRGRARGRVRARAAGRRAGGAAGGARRRHVAAGGGAAGRRARGRRGRARAGRRPSSRRRATTVSEQPRRARPARGGARERARDLGAAGAAPGGAGRRAGAPHGAARGAERRGGRQGRRRSARPPPPRRRPGRRCAPRRPPRPAAAAAVVEAQRGVTEAEDAHRAAVVERRGARGRGRPPARRAPRHGGRGRRGARGGRRASPAPCRSPGASRARPATSAPSRRRWRSSRARSPCPAASTTGRCSTRSSAPASGWCGWWCRRRRRPSVAFPGAAPLADKVSFGEHEELEGALADVVIVDDLRAVPDEFTGLAVTREGEYYRPADGQIGLASGVPAALLLERRASLERLGEKLGAVAAREVREEAAVTLAEAAARRGPRGRRGRVAGRARGAHRGRDGRARPGAGPRRAAATWRTHLQRDRRAWRASPPSSPRRRRPRRPPTRPPRARCCRPSSCGRPAPTPRRRCTRPRRRTPRRWRSSRAGASSSRSAAPRPRARRSGARRRASASPPTGSASRSSTGASTEIPAVREACTTVETRTGALRAHSTRLIAQLDVGDDEGAGLERGELRKLGRATSRSCAGSSSRPASGARRSRSRSPASTTAATSSPPALDEVSEQLDQAGFAPPADEAEEAQLRERVERLTRRRERIGPVNPLAEAECAELGGARRLPARAAARPREVHRRPRGAHQGAHGAGRRGVRGHVRGRAGAVQPHGDGAVPGRPRQPQARRAGRRATPGGVAVEVKPAKKLGKRCSCSPAASAPWWPSPSSWRWCWRGRARSTSSTRSRRPWTTSTSAAWCSCCATTASARSSSSSRTRSAPWRPPTCSTE